jgi:hypothetical protein
MGVDFIVTGHPPHRSITVCGKRIVDVDVGMTPAYQENMPQALAFSRNGIVRLGADGTEKQFARFGSADERQGGQSGGPVRLQPRRRLAR